MATADEPDVGLRRAAEPEVTLRPSLIHAHRRYRIGEGLTIGSALGAGVELDPEIATARHAVVRTTATGTPIVEDVSGIGLLVNDDIVRGQSHLLKGGDRIGIGGEALYVTDGTEALLPSMGLGPGERPVLTVGSDPGCDIVLAHPAVSPLHAVIEQRDGGAFVRDHSLRGGLRVDGRPATVEALEPGAELGVGPFQLVFDGATVIARDAGAVHLTASDVSRWVGESLILQPTTLSVSTGEMVAVIGTSGAGKSTLLRLLAATEHPDSGAIALGGEPIASRQADIGYVPQDEIVHAELTVVEALRYAALLRLPQDSGRERIEAAVDGIMDELGLAEHGATRVGNLSGGQRKRVGLATELVHQPAALLLDEPTTGLDPGLERRTMGLLRRLATGSRAVLLVTHATRSLSLCDKVMILAPGGYTCFSGAPREACEFFQVEELDEIYDALDDGEGEALAERFQASAEFERQHADAQLGTMSVGGDGAVGRTARLTFPRETATLVSRYLRVFTRDRRSLALLLGQAPVLGILAALMFAPGALNEADRARDATSLIFVLTTIAVWMGAISASREIVRERALLLREMALGVRLRSYLSSKMLIVSALAVLQVTAMAICALLLRSPDAGGAAVAGLVACLMLASMVSVAMGLAISAYAGTESQANSLIPLALVPQLLLGGAIVTVANMSAPMQAAAAFVFSRWSFAGAGSAYDLQRRIEADPQFSRVHEYGVSFFDVSLPALTLVAALFVAALLCLTAYLIGRERIGSG